ncbi:hypothetical protein CIB48_g3123 [Xylaria polymorpha]|nr:hypothetical protein CIB48_g3123 [Xylaria polymorpha]
MASKALKDSRAGLEANTLQDQFESVVDPVDAFLMAGKQEPDHADHNAEERGVRQQLQQRRSQRDMGTVVLNASNFHHIVDPAIVR